MFGQMLNELGCIALHPSGIFVGFALVQLPNQLIRSGMRFAVGPAMLILVVAFVLLVLTTMCVYWAEQGNPRTPNTSDPRKSANALRAAYESKKR